MGLNRMGARCDRPAKMLLRDNGTVEVYVCEHGHTHVNMTGPEHPGRLVFEQGNDAYTFGDAVMRAFDFVEGIEIER